MKPITYCVYRGDEFFVAQCLNVDVSSFGATCEEAVASLREAGELYFEGEPAGDFTQVSEAAVGEAMIQVWAARFRRNHPRAGHGFAFVSQRGSHCLFRNATGRIVIVPHPRRETPIGTTRSINRQSGLTPADFGF